LDKESRTALNFEWRPYTKRLSDAAIHPSCRCRVNRIAHPKNGERRCQ